MAQVFVQKEADAIGACPVCGRKLMQNLARYFDYSHDSPGISRICTCSGFARDNGYYETNDPRIDKKNISFCLWCWTEYDHERGIVYRGGPSVLVSLKKVNIRMSEAHSKIICERYENETRNE